MGDAGPATRQGTPGGSVPIRPLGVRIGYAIGITSGRRAALLAAVVAHAERHRCRRLWLITTNDNLGALAFYQRRGFTLAALHRDAAAVTAVKEVLQKGDAAYGVEAAALRAYPKLQQGDTVSVLLPWLAKAREAMMRAGGRAKPTLRGHQ